MKVEFLYPELTNLLGENGTQMLLRKIFGDDNVIRTSYPALPRFLREEVKLVIIGAMTEEKQKLILSLLLPFREAIKERLEAGQFFFFTGNAFDLLGKKICHEEGECLEALGLFDFTTQVARYRRSNAFVHGYTREESEIFGWISQFTEYSGELPGFVFSDNKSYGIHYKNLYATSLLGPLLITSPYFTKELLRAMGKEDRLPEEEDLLACFEKRREDRLKNMKLISKD